MRTTISIIILSILFCACSGTKIPDTYYNTPLTAKLIPVRDSETYLYGYVDNDGKTVIKPTYTSASYFQDGLALVTDTCGLKGFINQEGIYVIAPKFAQATDFHDGMAWTAEPDSALKAMNTSGEYVFSFPEATLAELWYNGFSAYMFANTRTGIVNSKGEDVKLPCEPISINLLEKGYALITDTNDKTMLFKLEGDACLRIAPELKQEIQNVNTLSERIIISENEKYGLADFKGNIIVQPQFPFMNFDGDNLILFRNDDNLYGWLDTSGKEVIDPTYLTAFYFKYNKHSAVQMPDSSYSIIDRNGKPTWTSTESIPSPTNTGVFTIKNINKTDSTDEGGISLIDFQGKRITDNSYKEITPLSGSLLMFKTLGSSSDYWRILSVKNPQAVPDTTLYTKPDFDKYMSASAESRLLTPEALTAIVDFFRSFMDFSATSDELFKRFPKWAKERNGIDINLANEELHGVEFGLWVFFDDTAVIKEESPLSMMFGLEPNYSYRTVDPDFFHININIKDPKKQREAIKILSEHLKCDLPEEIADPSTEFMVYFLKDGSLRIKYISLYTELLLDLVTN